MPDFTFARRSTLLLSFLPALLVMFFCGAVPGTFAAFYLVHDTFPATVSCKWGGPSSRRSRSTAEIGGIVRTTREAAGMR
jgi:hypothetical protein